MRIKKFFEFFDTQDLMDRHDGELKSSDLKADVSKDFSKENVHKFVTKLSKTHFPFIAAFAESASKDEKINIGNFSVDAEWDDTMDRWNFTAESDKYKLILGIVINRVSNYDVFIDLEDISGMTTLKTSARYDVDYNELVRLMNQIYIPLAKKYGFEKLLEYNQSNYIAKYN